MDPIVLSAGTALVGAIATDAWEQTRTAVVALWRRTRPDQAEVIDEEFADSRRRLLAAREEGDEEAERALVSDWQIRLQSLLRHDLSVADDLRALLSAELAAPDGGFSVGTQSMQGEASGDGRVFQAGRDQHITGS